LKAIIRYLSLAALTALTLTAQVGAAQERELDGSLPLTDPLVCLARTIYFEAGGQSLEEMAAVGHVVVNRVNGRGFPNDVCAVVRDGGRNPPCQFSWWCDDRSNVAADRKEYDRSVGVARDILDGRVTDPTDGANMFHNLEVTPGWAKVAELHGQIGDQLFYFLDER
jgi:spore germination cell wall hydrolase CwlJ-like protein